MGTYFDAKKLAQRQGQRFSSAARSVKLAHDVQLSAAMRKKALELTSGTETQKSLNRKGNPFGRGNGRMTQTRGFEGRQRRVRVARGYSPLLPINRQSGRLQKSLRVIREKDGFRLQFTDHTWQLRPGGTKNSVARGFWTALKKKRDAEVKKLIAAKRKAEHAP